MTFCCMVVDDLSNSYPRLLNNCRMSEEVTNTEKGIPSHAIIRARIFIRFGVGENEEGIEEVA